ncbi:MAG: hypothetical protein WCA13_09970 [Terriglobales bacterium]
MHIRLILLMAAVIAGLGAAVLRLTRKKPENKLCVRCGQPARHGYSKTAESAPEDIVPLCVPCIVERLNEDYRTYKGRAVVIQPVAELPCYIFRPRSDWEEPLRVELDTLLAGLQDYCSSCANPARYLWVSALDSGPVAKLPKIGITHTLLAASSARPISLCARCSVQRIARSFEGQEAGYLEVCGPRGDENGLVTAIGG